MESLPFWAMEPMDDAVTDERPGYGGAEAFGLPGEVYAIYLPISDLPPTLDLTAGGGAWPRPVPRLRPLCPPRPCAAAQPPARQLAPGFLLARSPPAARRLMAGERAPNGLATPWGLPRGDRGLAAIPKPKKKKI